MSERFDDEELRAAYAPLLRETSVAHGPDCPSETELLAAVRGEGPDARRLAVLDHALRCAACRGELALLHGVSGVHERPRVARPRVWQRWAPLVVAASLLLAIGLASVDRARRAGGDDLTRAVGEGGDVGLVSPERGRQLGAGQATFTWRPVAAVVRYTVEVDAADGSVLASTTTIDTTATLVLPAGAAGEARWLVRARLDDGTERRSEARAIRLR